MLKAVNIKWDTDGNMETLQDLPTEMIIPEGMCDEEEISNWLSDEVGFCHAGFELIDEMKKYIVEIEVYDNTELSYLKNTIDEALCDANVDCTFEVKEVEE